MILLKVFDLLTLSRTAKVFPMVKEEVDVGIPVEFPPCEGTTLSYLSLNGKLFVLIANILDSHLGIYQSTAAHMSNFWKGFRWAQPQPKRRMDSHKL